MRITRRTVLGAGLGTLAVPLAGPAFAQAPATTHTVGMVVSLTGPAGRFGQAAAKSVELLSLIHI